MFSENKTNAIYNLKGKVIRSFLVAVSEYLSLLLFILSTLSSCYLLLADTSLLAKLGIFSDEILLIAVCLFVVIENFMLFFIYIYAKLYSKNYFTFSGNVKITFLQICKAAFLYFNITVRKMFLYIGFLLPSLILFFSEIYLLRQGLSLSVAYILAAVCCILFCLGLIFCMIVTQKYYFVDILLCNEEKLSVRSILKTSATLTEGKCRKMLLLKLLNIPERILSFAVLPAIYFLPLCKATEADFALMKEIPYMRRKAHTEKAVVFYFEPVKEN